MEAEWRRKRERRRHFKEKMSLEEAHHHRRPWIRAWRKKKMNEGRGREVSSDCVYDYVLLYTLSMSVLEISFLNMTGILFEQVHHGVLNFWRYHSCLALFFFFFFIMILGIVVNLIICLFWTRVDIILYMLKFTVGGCFLFPFLNGRGYHISF